MGKKREKTFHHKIYDMNRCSSLAIRKTQIKTIIITAHLSECLE